MAVAHAVAPATPARQPPPRGAGRCQHGVPRRHLLVVDAWCRLVTRTSTCSSSATPRYRLVGTQSSPAWRRLSTAARRSQPRSRTAAACRGWPKTPWQSTRRRRLGRRRLAVAPRWWWWWCVETFHSRPGALAPSGCRGQPWGGRIYRTDSDLVPRSLPASYHRSYNDVLHVSSSRKNNNGQRDETSLMMRRDK